MPAATSLLLGTAAASLLAGGAGAIANASAADRANALQNQAVQQWLAINIPDPEKQKLALQQFVQTGKLSPEMEPAIKALPSQLAQVKPDAGLQAARQRALQSLENQGYGGAQVQDQAAQEQALIDAGAKNRGEQQAIESSLARRGQLGTGLELQARLQAAQGNNDQTASNALSLEAARRNRALQAVQGAGSLAGDIQNQLFNEKAEAAKAADAINMFNTQNTQNVANRNVNRSNEAQASNLALQQGIANQNTGLANFQQQYNQELQQQQFNNQAARAAGVAGQYNNQANTAMAQGANAANMWGGVARGIGTTGAGLIKDAQNQKTPDPYNLSSDNSTTQSDNDENWAQYIG